jgi:hypothetical protein
MRTKKIIKRALLAVFLLLGILIALPFIFKGRIIEAFKNEINKNLNATIIYDDIDVSIIKHFPNATLSINNFRIINKHPFEGDTLFISKTIFLDVNIRDLFKTDIEKIKIKDFEIIDSKLNLLVNKDGIENYNIAKKNNSESDLKTTEKSDDNGFVFNIKTYKLEKVTILYDNRQTDITLNLNHLNHTGHGDFSQSQMALETKSTIDDLTLKMGNVNYFNETKIDLDAIIAIDFDTMTFSFKENVAQLNDLKLVFNGFVKLNDTSQDINIKFDAPKANFKSILSLIPNAYTSDFKGVSASGLASVSGTIKGKNSDKAIPNYNIHIKTNNATFKYPDLPKSVKNIVFDGAIVNTSSKNNTFLNINNLKFTIDEDTFEAKGKVTNLISNPTVDAAFKGTLNLENLSKAYPIDYDGKLAGILKADVTTFADKNSIQQNRFDKIKTNGTASLQDFMYDGQDVAHPVYVKNANVKFNTSTILLSDFNAKTGKSDISATGNLDNLYAFLFDEKDLKGRFKVRSNNFVVSDFLVDENVGNATSNDQSKSTSIESLKIPDFLDVTTIVNAKKVVYDDLELQNVSGIMALKNQIATLTDLKANMLDGQMVFNGNINTKESPSNFDLDLNIVDFDIANSFKVLETFKKLVPIAKALKGKYNTTFKIKGNLDDAFLPELNSLKGNAFAQMFVKNIDQSAMPIIQGLTSNLNFIDFNKLKLDKIKTALTFENGKVKVKPFDLKYQDITMHITGSHGFDKSLDYNLQMDVPAKYLGKDAVNLLSKLSNIDKDTIKVPLTTLINGSVLKPNIEVNLQQAMTVLAQKVIKYQKDKITNQVTSTVEDIISNTGLDSILPASNDSTKANPGDFVKDGVNDLLNGLFKKKKKKKDTVN